MEVKGEAEACDNMSKALRRYWKTHTIHPMKGKPSKVV